MVLVIFHQNMLQGERDGSNEYNDYQPGSLKTTDQVIKDLKNVDIVFHIGDITYSNGYISQWDQFTAQVQPIASTVPYMIARLVDNQSFHSCFFSSTLAVHYIISVSFQWQSRARLARHGIFLWR